MCNCRQRRNQSNGGNWTNWSNANATVGQVVAANAAARAEGSGQTAAQPAETAPPR